MKANITRSFETFPGFVYFVQNEESGLVKIGWTSKNVLDRIDQIRYASGASISIIGALYGSRRDENTLHVALQASRAHGEWFRAEPELMAYIAGLST